MKIKFIHIIFLLSLLFMMGCNQKKELMPSLNESFKKEDKKPFGSYVAFSQLKNIFTDKYIETNDVRFDDEWNNIKDYSTASVHSLYVLITKNLSLSYSEANAMSSFVKEGNDLFIAADYIDTELQSKLNFITEREEELIKEVGGYMHTTNVKMFFGNDFKAPEYKYYYYPFLNSLDGYDSLQTRVLGVNETGKPNYIVMFIGKGRLYLHAAPRVFSNYFLLTQHNYEYLENVLSYLRPDPKNIYWDEYYKNQNLSRSKRSSGGSGSGNNSPDNNFSSFNVINKNPPLRWAFWLAVIALLLYILFNIKRKQRVIEEIKPNTNSTVAFTETVGRLYLQKKDNKNISEKMITYFYEHLRNNYFLNTNQVDDKFIGSLSGKSGVPAELTKKLFDVISQVQSNENISDQELLSLNELIQNFYKNKN